MVRNLVLIFLLFFASYSLAFSSEEKRQDKYARLAEIADNIAKQYEQMGWFSGSLLITNNDEPVFSSSYGFQNIEGKIKNSTESRFNLGSIMKDFTKVLILQQVEAGELKLSDKLVSFELGFKQAHADGITIEHLLNFCVIMQIICKMYSFL